MEKFDIFSRLIGLVIIILCLPFGIIDTISADFVKNEKLLNNISHSFDCLIEVKLPYTHQNSRCYGATSTFYFNFNTNHNSCQETQ